MDYKNNLEETIERLVKSKKKTINILIITIFCLTGVSTFFGFIYIDLYGKHEQLTNDYSRLIGEYIELNEDYDELEDDFDNLTSEYNNLTLDYNDLVNDYNILVSNYNSLFGSYQSILSVLEDPLTDPDIPTINEVQAWLSIDDTDKIEYDNISWMCGDFASMLMVKAKEKNWRIRVALMFYSFSGNTTYGTNDPYGEYGHAFNLIYCQDGDDPGTELDIYYIEPQTDRVWYVIIGPKYHTHYIIYTYFTGGISGTVWHSPYWINHYSYFA